MEDCDLLLFEQMVTVFPRQLQVYWQGCLSKLASHTHIVLAGARFSQQALADNEVHKMPFCVARVSARLCK